MCAKSKLLHSFLFFSLIVTMGMCFAKEVKKEEDYKKDPLYPHLCPLPIVLKEGFYFGFGLGYDSVHSHTTFDQIAPIGISGNRYQRADGLGGTLYIGYGSRVTDLLYIGGEAVAYYSHLSNNVTVKSKLGYLSHNFETNGDYELAFLPGIRITNTSMIYLRLGYDWGNIQTNGRLFTNASQSLFLTNDEKVLNGFAYGVGFESLLKNHWSLRVDYTHINYHASTSTSKLGIKINPWDERLTVALVFHFP